MPTNLLLLPFLGGYWFIHNLQYTRSRAQRLDGYRLLVESAMVGVVLAALARVAVVGLKSWTPAHTWWLAFAPNDIPYLGTAVGALLLGIIAPYFIDGFLNVTGLLPAHRAHYRAIGRYGNALLRLLHESAASEYPVSIVLDNRKVYIGQVVEAPSLEPQDTYVALVPFFSGYRDTATLELVITVAYLPVYEQAQVNPADFKVVLPLSSIRIASFFDQAMYPQFLDAAPVTTEPPDSPAG